MKRMGQTVIGGLLLTLCLLAPGAAGAEEMKPGDVDVRKAKSVHFLVPSSEEIIASTAGQVDPKQLASHVGEGEASALYGFSTGISEEKGSFKLGVLLTDVNVALAGNDKEKAVKALNALTEGLSGLGASDELVQSTMNMTAALVEAKDISALAPVVIPALQPFIRKFIKDEGKLEYLQLGEWCQTVRLAAAAATKENLATVRTLLAQPAIAGYFSDAFAKAEAVPPGVKQALKELAQYKQDSVDDLKAVGKIKTSVEEIIKVMG